MMVNIKDRDLEFLTEETRKKVEEAKAILAVIGVEESVYVFLSSEEVCQIQTKAFEEQEKRGKRLKDTAPEELSELAEAIYEFLSTEKETFVDEINLEFICQIAARLQEYPCKYFTEILDEETLQGLFKECQDTSLEFMEKIAKAKVDTHIDFCMERLYEGDLPAGIPKELANYLMHISGGRGVGIPMSAYFHSDTETECSGYTEGPENGDGEYGEDEGGSDDEESDEPSAKILNLKND